MKRIVAFAVAAALVVASESGVQAGIVLDASFNTNGTPYATIERSTSQTVLGPSVVRESVYTGPFSVTATGWTRTGPFDAFCVDLWHVMGTSDPGISAVAVAPLSTIKGPPYFPLTSDTQVGNKMSFLMKDYASNTSWTADQKGAFQLALWSLTDPNFRVISTSTAGLQSAFNGILGLFDHKSWSGLDPYASPTTYGGGTFFKVSHVGDRYQDLVTAVPGGDDHGPPPMATPEPSTWTMIMISGAIVGIGRWARNRRTPH